MEFEPLVSVLIPCYNVSKYIDKAVRSILDQTYTNLEILIIDDASTDDTLAKIKMFNDRRIRVIEFAENTHKVGAVNTVLQQAKGELICFQDADDWSEPTRIEEQVKAFYNDRELGICFTAYRNTGTRKADIGGEISLTNEELRNEFFNFTPHRCPNYFPTSCPTMMITKDALDKTRGYHPYFTKRVAEDIHWIYRILKLFKGVTVNKVLYNYNAREGSFTDLQFRGVSAKYAYAWQLVSAIINKDINENIDVLDPKYKEELKSLELEACEQALIEKVNSLNELRSSFENSASFRLGKLLLAPFHLLKSAVK